MANNFVGRLAQAWAWLKQRPEAIVFVVWLGWLGFLAMPYATSAVGAVTATNSLLHGLTPVTEQRVQRPEAMTDGVSPEYGDSWNSDLTAVFTTQASMVFDMGQSKPIRAVFIVADGNEEYLLSVSEDNVNYEPLWTAPATREAGMQPRETKDLDAKGRYVKVRAKGGDLRYSIGELQVFDKVGDGALGQVVKRRGLDISERVRSYFVHLIAAMGLMLFASRRESRWWWKVLMVGLPALVAGLLVKSISDGWPVDAQDVSMARATAAAIAILAVAREVVAPKRFAASKAVVIPTLVFAGLLGVASFYNLGHLQFPDHANGNQTFVHTYDMRVYYPVAKYFKELRFDGLYLGSVAAAKADDPGITRDRVARVELRDLKTHRMTRAGDVWEDILAIEKRFSPERWKEFVEDMRYFRETMGPSYFGSMVDHGGNATPVWLAQANLLFSKTKASELTLVLGGLVDPVLLLIGFLMIAWAYGWRASLLCMVVFGANDYVMFGTNWAGATMRHDWLAYLMIAIALLKKRKFAAGGVLLAMAGSARAFPALALVGLGFPTAVWFILTLISKPKSLALSKWPSVHRDVLRVAIGAVAGGVVLFVFASAVLSIDAWPEWLHKVGMLDRDPHVNEVGLRSLVAGARGDYASVMALRGPIVVLVGGGIALVALILGWKRSLDQLALLGAMMIPIVFNPANYYIHFITVLPLLAFTVDGNEGKKTLTWAQAPVVWSMLVLCVLQFWTTKVSDTGLHFELATVLLFVCYLAVFLSLWYANKTSNCFRPDYHPILVSGPVLPAQSTVHEDDVHVQRQSEQDGEQDSERRDTEPVPVSGETVDSDDMPHEDSDSPNESESAVIPGEDADPGADEPLEAKDVASESPSSRDE